MIIHDQHVHSYYSFDSEQRIEEYLNKVVQLGLDYFILTDHCDLNYLNTHKDLFFDIKKQHEELKELQSKYSNIKILHGIEIGYVPNEINRIKDIIKNNHFDLINLSLHESDGIDYYYIDQFQKFGVEKTLEIYFSRELEMVREFDDYDVFSHVDYGFKTAYLSNKSLSIKKYETLLMEIMKEIIKKDKALEINIKVQNILPIEHTRYLLNLYKKLGGKYLTLSSDAHDISMFRYDFDKYNNIIKEAGFTHLVYFINRKRCLLEI